MGHLSRAGAPRALRDKSSVVSSEGGSSATDAATLRARGGPARSASRRDARRDARLDAGRRERSSPPRSSVATSPPPPKLTSRFPLELGRPSRLSTARPGDARHGVRALRAGARVASPWRVARVARDTNPGNSPPPSPLALSPTPRRDVSPTGALIDPRAPAHTHRRPRPRRARDARHRGFAASPTPLPHLRRRQARPVHDPWLLPVPHARPSSKSSSYLGVAAAPSSSPRSTTPPWTRSRSPPSSPSSAAPPVRSPCSTTRRVTSES